MENVNGELPNKLQNDLRFRFLRNYETLEKSQKTLSLHSRN